MDWCTPTVLVAACSVACARPCQRTPHILYPMYAHELWSKNEEEEKKRKRRREKKEKEEEEKKEKEEEMKKNGLKKIFA